MLYYTLAGASVGTAVGVVCALEKRWKDGGTTAFGRIWVPFAGYVVISSASTGAAVGLLLDVFLPAEK
uniref:Uncharacterized protein n=1 Tax=viral metagenome TaxID=1070528 RepID=A0A6C0BMR9_9ZZZZ